MNDERAKMTPERIVTIAKQKGCFEVSWRWRDDWLRARCEKLVKAGLLRQKRGKPGTSYFGPAIAQPTTVEGE